MSSSNILVSLCVIRIEIDNPESSEIAAGGMAARKMRGGREPRDITVESYASVTEGPVGLLSSRGPGKSNSASRANSEETSTSTVPTSGPSEGDVATSCSPLDQINFFSGNPFVEVTKGILHLFKEDNLTEMHCAAERSHTICILSVPATMTCHDLLTFTAACHQNIQHFRIIRDGSPNQYMALVTFRSAGAASEFYETYNGAPYNSLEPDMVCHLVFISRVEVADSGLPVAGHTELPSCPVCLERMDESVDGILTILCNHAFHSSCLVKWGDTSCPVCRYVQTPEPVADSHCMQCGASSEALWICLICGHVGCSRYHEGHAFEHYRDTHHCYAMQLGNNRVWDYVGDNFVHRLLQDKDGKMVEGSGESAKGERTTVDEKVDSVQLEFTYLLTSQLETQRQFFEEKLTRLEQHTVSDNTELLEKLGQISEENAKTKEQLGTLMKEKQSLEKKLHHTNTKLTQVIAELSEERQLSKAIQSNQAGWQTKYKQLELEFDKYKNAKEAESNDLREQLRDVMFFLEAQKQIESSADREEIAAGRIIMDQSSSTSSSSGSRRSQRHQKKH